MQGLLIRFRHLRPVVLGCLAVGAVGAFTAGCGAEQSQPQAVAVARTASPDQAAAQAQLRQARREKTRLRREIRQERLDQAAAAQAAQPETESRQDTPADATTTVAADGRLLSRSARRDFRALRARLGGRVGVAVSGVGPGERVVTLGDLRSGVAWSTSKVPVALAVIAAGHASRHNADLRAALTVSDNAAAQRLWAALGGGTAAAAAADAQLRAAGDQRTRVQAQQLRPEFSAFGQTDWRLDDQARFMAGIGCLRAGGPVLDLMRSVDPSQRWGLGAVDPSAAFKGGWGPGIQPGQAGGYFDRQLGLITVHGKPVAVAIAAAPADGSHDTATQELTELARWVAAHVNVRRLPSQAAC